MKSLRDPCIIHPLGWLRASALTCCLISLVDVKWSCLLIKKQAFPPIFIDLGLAWDRGHQSRRKPPLALEPSRFYYPTVKG